MVEYANGKPLSEIVGDHRIATRTAKIVHNPDRPTVADLDALPDVIEVYTRDLDVRRYNVPFLLHPFVALYTHSRLPRAVHLLPLAANAERTSVAQALVRRRRPRDGEGQGIWPYVKEFFFDDDTFNIQKARTIELCAKLKPLNLTWSCTSRVTTDYETLKAMKEAGCRLLIVGYESGDPQILKNIKKGATVERARQFTKDCKKLGLVSPRRLHPRTPRRDPRNHSPHHRLRQGTQRRNHSGLRRARLSRHRDVRLRQGERLHRRTRSDMVDDGGHQVAQIEYPGLPRDYVMEMVHRFYDEYYFRPKGCLPHRAQAHVFNGPKSASASTRRQGSFLKLRAARNKATKDMVAAKQALRKRPAGLKSPATSGGKA